MVIGRLIYTSSLHLINTSAINTTIQAVPQIIVFRIRMFFMHTDTPTSTGDNSTVKTMLGEKSWRVCVRDLNSSS